MVLSSKHIDCLAWVGDVSFLQVKEFQYLQVLFMNAGMMELKVSVAAPNQVWSKSWARRLSFYQSVLIHGHEWWVKTEGTRSWIQAARMGFLCRVAGAFLRDRVRNLDSVYHASLQYITNAKSLSHHCILGGWTFAGKISGISLFIKQYWGNFHPTFVTLSVSGLVVTSCTPSSGYFSTYPGF